MANGEKIRVLIADDSAFMRKVMVSILDSDGSFEVVGEARDGRETVEKSVKLKPQAEDQRIRALMTVAVEGNRTDEVLRGLRGDPAVCALHTTNGRWDIVAELRTDSLEAVDRVLGRIRQIDGISNTETSLLLSTHKF